MKTLFVTWDGPGPNYHESLFLPIFRRHVRHGSEIHLLQYAWSAHERTATVREAARLLGMPYTVRRVWRTAQLLSTPCMIARGAVDLVRYVQSNEIDVLMPRSIIPAAMALLALRLLPGVKLLFDADGLMADERADFGGWSREGKAYRILRAIESAAVRRADVVITRTEGAKRLLADRAGLTTHDKIVVVSNGRDVEAFYPFTAADRSLTRKELGVPQTAPLLVYAGSLAEEKYNASRLMAFFGRVREQRPDAHFLVLSGSPVSGEVAARAANLPEGSYTIRKVVPAAVPKYLAAGDLGLVFVQPSLSMTAAAPIKAGEYMLCGVPVLSTSGIGDLDEQLGANTGKLLANLHDEMLAIAADWFLREVYPNRERFRDACREAGLQWFSLDRSVAQYRTAFRLLADPGAGFGPSAEGRGFAVL